MPTLIFRFPAGRYHATPWGHHVNEGLVEWPPSPWRILRALIATGYAKLGWKDVPPEGRTLVEALASTLPVYRLPSAVLAHSRHYMPLGVLDKGREKTTLVFDAWARVNGELATSWDVALPPEAADLLETLVRNWDYLGRSESWVEARLSKNGSALPAGSESMPDAPGLRPTGSGWEQVALLAAEPAATYGAWRKREVAEALQSLSSTKGRNPPKARENERSRLEEPFPPDLLACLQVDSAWLKGHGWSQPPGARRVLYWRRADAFEVGAPRPAYTPPNVASVEAMLLALSTPSRNMHALPAIVRTLPQGELLHRALVQRVCKSGQAGDTPEILGQDALGKPLRQGHRHAHLLPLDLDGDGHLDHVLVWSPMGLSATAQGAVRTIRQTFTKGGVGDLRVALAGAGRLDNLRSLPPPLANGITRLIGPPGGARMWTTWTPFVPPRFLKARGRNSIAGQVAAEIASRGLPEATVEVLPIDAAASRLRHFVRVRHHGGTTPPMDAGFRLRLTFARPVPGPVCLGYGSHFGLGLFAAEE